MKTHNATIKMIVGSTIALSVSMPPAVHAEQNPFRMQPLAHGYMLAETEQASDDDKMKDGNCSAEMKKGDTDSSNSDPKGKDGNCSAEMQGSDNGTGNDAK